MINGQQAPNNNGVVNLGELPFQTDYSGITIGTTTNGTTLDGRDITIGNTVNFPQVAILGTGFNINTSGVNIGTDTTKSVTVSAQDRVELICNNVTLGTTAVKVQGEDLFAPSFYTTNLFVGAGGGGPRAKIELAPTSDKIIITCGDKKAEIPLS